MGRRVILGDSRARQHIGISMLDLTGILPRERRTERFQALTRLAVASLIAGYVLLARVRGAGSPFSSASAILALGYACLCLLNYATILRWPQPWILRRCALIATDVGAVSSMLYLSGEAGAFLYPLYLWVIVGNGLRFGVPYLAFALVLSLAGFGLVGYAAPFWSEHAHLSVALLVGIGTLPLFYATLLREIEHANKDLAALAEKASHAASHDPLTGLANRRVFFDRLQHTIEIARRHGTLVGVVFIDLDGFKYVNDTFGHAAGDELLRQIAQRLDTTLRRADTVARYGGDEFVVLLEDLRDDRDLKSAVRRAASVFAKPYLLNGEQYRTRGSVGVSVFPRDGEDAQTLVQRADRAMYEAKKLGEHQFDVSDVLERTGDANRLLTSTHFSRNRSA
jgi:diguanylate cyclase (GGDEF)-like protein